MIKPFFNLFRVTQTLAHIRKRKGNGDKMTRRGKGKSLVPYGPKADLILINKALSVIYLTPHSGKLPAQEICFDL